MTPGTRKLAVTLHVAVAVGWLGLDLGLLTLGVTGLASRDPRTAQAAYRAMGILGDVLVIPVSLATLLTGVLLGLGTRWGLLRYYWVLAKLVLTLAAALASTFALRATIHRAVAGLPAAGQPVDPGAAGISLVVAPTVALLVYGTATVLSVYKPWGRVRRTNRRTSTLRSPA